MKDLSKVNKWKDIELSNEELLTTFRKYYTDIVVTRFKGNSLQKSQDWPYNRKIRYICDFLAFFKIYEDRLKELSEGILPNYNQEIEKIWGTLIWEIGTVSSFIFKGMGKDEADFYYTLLLEFVHDKVFPSLQKSNLKSYKEPFNKNEIMYGSMKEQTHKTPKDKREEEVTEANRTWKIKLSEFEERRDAILSKEYHDLEDMKNDLQKVADDFESWMYYFKIKGRTELTEFRKSLKQKGVIGEGTVILEGTEEELEEYSKIYNQSKEIGETSFEGQSRSSSDEDEDEFDEESL